MTAPTPSDPSKWLIDLLAGQQEMFRILGGGAEPAASGEATPPPALPLMSPWVEGTKAMLAWQQQASSWWTGALAGAGAAGAQPPAADRRFAGEAWRNDPRFEGLSVKGPEVLNMWLGESERQVRDLFSQCREKAAEGHLAFLFIDEAESILGTRHATRIGTNILSTLVPMFCTEMDGLESLQNVVVIIASNRADLIDPAILRPGRIDRKIRVRRPDKEAAREIYKIYLKAELPLAEPVDSMVEAIVDAHYAKSEENRFLDVTYRSGRHDYLFRGDLASGAIIAAIVERGKEYAIKRCIEKGEESPLCRQDLLDALQKEYRENDLFPPSDITEDWLKLTDMDPGNVVRLSPYRTSESGGSSGTI